MKSPRATSNLVKLSKKQEGVVASSGAHPHVLQTLHLLTSCLQPLHLQALHPRSLHLPAAETQLGTISMFCPHEWFDITCLSPQNKAQQFVHYQTEWSVCRRALLPCLPVKAHHLLNFSQIHALPPIEVGFAAQPICTQQSCTLHTELYSSNAALTKVPYWPVLSARHTASNMMLSCLFRWEVIMWCLAHDQGSPPG